MIESLLDPLTLFFLLGVLAGLLRTDLRLPEAIYYVLGAYLLLAIGLKGGAQLATGNLPAILLPGLGTLGLGLVIPIVAYVVLRRLGRFSRPDAAAIAAHYGSVSAVTFAVVQTYLDRLTVAYEAFMPVLLVLLEVPAIAIAISIVRLRERSGRADYGLLVHEVMLNRGIYLLLGGLVIGALSGPARLAPLEVVFVDAFKGALAFFLLELGIVAAQRLGDLRRVGPFLIVFAVVMPLVSALLGTAVGVWVGLTFGGTVVLATMAASASYIAASAAMQIAVPEANPTLYLTAALGITFPFNITIGIPLYVSLARVFYQ